MINFPTGWGLRINLTKTLSGPQVYQADPLLALLPVGTCWAHWLPRNLEHTSIGWSPCLSMFDDSLHPKETLIDAKSGSLFLIGKDIEQFAVRNGTDTVKQIAKRHADQLEIVRQWANDNDKEFAWAGPQWNVNGVNLGLLEDWVHELRQHQGHARSGHRLAVHLYGAWDAQSFWAIVDRFEVWRSEKFPEVPVVVTEFSGWPGTSMALQMEVMAAGREYLRTRDYVEWVAWFSGYRFTNDADQAWGTELAAIDEDGVVKLTELGQYWLSLV